MGALWRAQLGQLDLGDPYKPRQHQSMINQIESDDLQVSCSKSRDDVVLALEM